MAPPKQKSAGKRAQPANAKSGIYIFKDGSKYEGEYKLEDGVIVRHGAGKYTCANTKISYTGNWESDKMSGNGRLEFPFGAIYEGNFKNNMYSGSGNYTWPDASSFSGEWENNLLNGRGKFKDIDGETWTGSVNGYDTAILTPEL